MLFRSPFSLLVAVVAAVVSLVSSEQGSGVNPDCATETAALRNNPNITQVYQDLVNGSLELFDPVSCNNNGEDCTYDLSTSSDNFNAVCDSAGGKAVYASVTFYCDVNGAEGTSVEVVGLPDCVGTSCSTAQGEDYLDTAANTFADDVLNSIDGFQKCSADAEVVDAANDVLGGSTILLLGMGALASTMAMML